MEIEIDHELGVVFLYRTVGVPSESSLCGCGGIARASTKVNLHEAGWMGGRERSGGCGSAGKRRIIPN